MDWSEPDPIDIHHQDRAAENWTNRATAGLTGEDWDIYMDRGRDRSYGAAVCDTRDATIMRVLTRLAQKGIKPVARPLASHLGH